MGGGCGKTEGESSGPGTPCFYLRFAADILTTTVACPTTPAMAGSSVSILGPEGWRVLDLRPQQTRGWAGAWPRSPVSKEKVGGRVCCAVWGLCLLDGPTHLIVPMSSWCLLLVSPSEYFSLNSLCFTRQLFPCVSLSLLLSLCAFFLPDCAGLGPGRFLPGVKHLSLSSVSLVHLSPPADPISFRMCPTRPRCQRVSEWAP